MKELVELYNLINKSDFRHKLWEISCSDSEIDFKIRHTLCGTYLSGKILFDSNHYIVYNYVGYDDVTVPLSKVEYGIKVRDEIIVNLSDLLSRLIEFSNFSDKRFSDFEEYSAPSDTTGWRQVFIDELTNRFGDTDIILKSMNIKLVICFDEHTDLFSVILKRGEVSTRSKILLQETVDGSNYKEILGIIDRIYSDFKHDFYDINGIAEQLKNFGY
jgi:hypothetical protein